MRESLRRAPRKANRPGAQSCTRKGTSVHYILPLERWARAVWPQKPVDNLKAITGRSVRTIKYQLRGRPLSRDDIVALLRSEHGFSFLQYLMAGADPLWWKGIVRVRSVATLRRQIAEQQKRLAQLEFEID